ncbi:malate synthase [Deinococcus reticulitermitis]|uniref:malate synthase n=1 Tax=Deinococcus reticulitermitis TaxID=856736 RepID=A0A1H6ZKM2_9DEIO|nr:malate synthase A [Deinococcus reticulitermitis]SEJ50130.1 malate synthase [Deinococcus reticulitermitis]
MDALTVFLAPAAHALAERLHAELRAEWEALTGPTPPQGRAPDVPASFRAAPVPDDLRTRRAELIVEASDAVSLRAALRGDADAVVVDFDDTFSPTPENVARAYALLADEVGRSEGALLCRPRALYATEPHLNFGGPAIAALCDLAAALTARPERPLHLYVPKLETVAEAGFWDRAITLAEEALGWAPNTVRVCLQIETFPGLLNAEALLGVLCRRAYGLNAGRWDYVFSLIKHLGQTRTVPLPPRSGLTMEMDAMRAYAEGLVQVCRAHGAEAIGGTASFAPDPADPQPALAAVLADKQREAAQGFTAAWAGLPELLDPVRQGFQSEGPPPAPVDPTRLAARLTELPDPGPLRLGDVREALDIALGVFAAWYEGRGVLVRQGRIEDTATAELARAGLWQWVRVGAALEGGGTLSRERYLAERRVRMPDGERPARLLDHLVLAERCPAYFPQEARRLEEPR